MSVIIDNSLKFLIADSEIYRTEAVGGILVGHDHKNEEEIDKAHREYDKYDRLVSLGYQMLIDGHLKDWDWKFVADKGWLCDMDFEWFKEDLEKAGVSKEEYNKSDILEFQMDDLKISQDESVFDMVESHKNKDEVAFQDAYVDYQKISRKIIMCEEMKKENLGCWDWKWLADSGNLCKKDFEWFKEDLEKAGVGKEEYDKKWK